MTDDVEIKIVHDDAEYAQAMAVRREVFVYEQNIPENKEFDGNDHGATHVLALCGGKPVGVMRIRYFNGFVKFERMCVLKGYRKSDISERIMQKGMEFAAQKGYDKVYGICKKELLSRWKKDGFSEIPGAEPTEQNGMILIPVCARLPEVPNVLTMQTPAEILNAREGEWDTVGSGDVYADMRRHMQNRLQEIRLLKKQPQFTQSENIRQRGLEYKPGFDPKNPER